MYGKRSRSIWDARSIRSVPPNRHRPAVCQHSGHVSPIDSSTSRTSAAAASEETPRGGYLRATTTACSRACGSARSCIQPWSAHSRMTCVSFSTAIAHPRSVRIAGRPFLVTSIEISPPERILGLAIRSDYEPRGVIGDAASTVPRPDEKPAMLAFHPPR
jgi:hypothetical protein